MSSTSIGQLMAELRQLVINLQHQGQAADTAVGKSQIVNDKITGMKEYQEEVASMNDCWRMQGRKALVAGLQQENRQILQLQQENRELRQILEDCESTLQLVMQKHRIVVTRFSQELAKPSNSSVTMSEPCENKIAAKIVSLSRLLDECLTNGEKVSNRDQELLSRLVTENGCLRELLNISARVNPALGIRLLKHTATNHPTGSVNNHHTACNDDNEDEEKDELSTPTSSSPVRESWSGKTIIPNSS